MSLLWYANFFGEPTFCSPRLWWTLTAEIAFCYIAQTLMYVMPFLNHVNHLKLKLFGLQSNSRSRLTIVLCACINHFEMPGLCMYRWKPRENFFSAIHSTFWFAIYFGEWRMWNKHFNAIYNNMYRKERLIGGNNSGHTLVILF